MIYQIKEQEKVVGRLQEEWLYIQTAYNLMVKNKKDERLNNVRPFYF
jgi:plasmid maintenance system antidote protein VapI